MRAYEGRRDGGPLYLYGQKRDYGFQFLHLHLRSRQDSDTIYGTSLSTSIIAGPKTVLGYSERGRVCSPSLPSDRPSRQSEEARISLPEADRLLLLHDRS